MKIKEIFKDASGIMQLFERMDSIQENTNYGPYLDYKLSLYNELNLDQSWVIENFENDELQSIVGNYNDININNPKFVVEISVLPSINGRKLVVFVMNIDDVIDDLPDGISKYTEFAKLHFEDTDKLDEFLTYLSVGFGHIDNLQIIDKR